MKKWNIQFLMSQKCLLEKSKGQKIMINGLNILKTDHLMINDIISNQKLRNLDWTITISFEEGINMLV